jgi:predicted amidohydrolase
MHQNLRVTLVQSDLHWENIDANLDMFSQKIAGISGSTDLIVLPEMFSTGFSMHVETLAEEPGRSKAIEWMKRTAAERECVVTGSLMIRETPGCGKARPKYFNRLIWMEPDGHYLHYDKRHLFGLSNEEQVYTAGDTKIITVWKGWKICPLVCYDLRFPVWSRNSADGYDLLLYVANWPERRIYAWKQLVVARAIENQCYVAGLNRVGNDGGDIYHSGDSMAVDAVGNVLYHKKDEEDVVTVELNYEALQKTREALPFLKDADAFALNPKGKIKAH